ncbi:MAG: hypothetical protein HY554_15340, partial [Elusimicrobia bacterium]|nr:hypothetical protein [Elusimicrobiota bacterium]
RRGGPGAPGGAVAAEPPRAGARRASPVLRRSDFTVQGQLVVRDAIPLPRPSRPARAGVNRSLAESLRVLLYRLGNRSGWTDPFVGKVLAATANRAIGGLDEALVLGVDALYPSALAKRGALSFARSQLERYDE